MIALQPCTTLICWLKVEGSSPGATTRFSVGWLGDVLMAVSFILLCKTLIAGIQTLVSRPWANQSACFIADLHNVLLGFGGYANQLLCRCLQCMVTNNTSLNRLTETFMCILYVSWHVIATRLHSAMKDLMVYYYRLLILQADSRCSDSQD